MELESKLNVVGEQSVGEQSVIFRIGSDMIGIKITHINSITLLSQIVKIPRSPDHVIGVTRIENSILPVISIDTLLGLDVNLASDHSTGIVVQSNNNAFCIYSASLPVIDFLHPVDLTEKSSFIVPDDWIEGHFANEDNRVFPMLDPQKFWISLDKSHLVGPSALDSSRISTPDSSSTQPVPEIAFSQNTDEGITHVSERVDDSSNDAQDKKKSKKSDKSETSKTDAKDLKDNQKKRKKKSKQAKKHSKKSIANTKQAGQKKSDDDGKKASNVESTDKNED